MTQISHNQFGNYETPESPGDTSAQLGTLALGEMIVISEQYRDTASSASEVETPDFRELTHSDETARLHAEAYAAERKLAARNALLDIRDTQDLSDEELVQYINLHTVMHGISTLHDPQTMIAASHELHRAIHELQRSDYSLSA